LIAEAFRAVDGGRTNDDSTSSCFVSWRTDPAIAEIGQSYQDFRIDFGAEVDVTSVEVWGIAT
jgi:hypothetical protein